VVAGTFGPGSTGRHSAALLQGADQRAALVKGIVAEAQQAVLRGWLVMQTTSRRVSCGEGAELRVRNRPGVGARSASSRRMERSAGFGKHSRPPKPLPAAGRRWGQQMPVLAPRLAGPAQQRFARPGWAWRPRRKRAQAFGVPGLGVREPGQRNSRPGIATRTYSQGFQQAPVA